MAPLFHLYIFAGLSFAFAIINIVIGIQKSAEKSYLYFGIISFCVGMYYMLFPAATSQDYFISAGILGLSFFIAAFGFFPWFIKYYTTYKHNVLPWLLSSGMALTLLLFLLSNDSNGIPWWNVIAHITILGIICFGFFATHHLNKKGNTPSALILLFSFIFFFLLTIDDIIYVHFNKYYLFDLPADILPFDYFFIFFMIIMGIKLSADMQQKLLLEKRLVLKEKRWGNLLEKVQLLVVGVNKNGEIYYVNPFFLKLTAFVKDEIIGQHYMKLIPEKDRESLGELADTIKSPEELPYYQNNILTKSGDERTISWSAVGIYDEAGNYKRTISIGSDITDQHNAFEEINLLKSRLELENILLKSELGQVSSTDKIIGKSDAIRYVLQRAGQVAVTDSTVLLEGETGVGKELIANYVQAKSKRSDKPFIKVNCSAIPATLLESELFGHMKGAFTGADKNKRGLVEMANGGTLFLDEIGEFPLELQPKLLRFLQDGEFKPLGSETGKKADVRIITATNRELLTEVGHGRFRDDLYYRISVYPITIPALRNRKEDIRDLIEIFVKKYANKHGKTISKISKTVMDILLDYHWPGNIRELENVIERAVIISGSDTIKIKDIPLPSQENQSVKTKSDSKIQSLESVEREHIVRVLKTTGWKIHGKDGAAELLDINPNTLRSRMKKLDISKP